MEGARVNDVCEVTVNEEFSNKLYNSFNSSPARSAGQTDAGFESAFGGSDFKSYDYEHDLVILAITINKILN